MSDTRKPTREWHFYVADMHTFATKVLVFTQGMGQQQFIDDEITFDAVLRNLELIGEAATHIPDDVRAAHKEIPWRMIIATRNRLIHAYLGIDNHTIWSIIQDDVPQLLDALERFLEEIDNTA